MKQRPRYEPSPVDIASATVRPTAGEPWTDVGTGRRIEAIGRDQELHDLDAILAGDPAVVITEANEAAGQGGLGKTWLAQAYAAWRADRFPQGANVLSLRGPMRGRVALAALGVRRGYADRGSLEARVHATRAALAQQKDRLLILDDVPDAATAAAALPPDVPVLMTARRANWASYLGAPQLPLGHIRGEDAARILQMGRSDLAPNHPDLARIATALDGIPAALSHAAAVLRARRRDRFADPLIYLQDLRKVQIGNLALAMPQGVRSPVGHEAATARAITVAFGCLSPTHGPDITALFLLRAAAAFLPDEPIPEGLLRRAAEIPEAGPGREQVSQALQRLVDLGLLRRAGPTGGLEVPHLVAGLALGDEPQNAASARALAEAAVCQAAGAALAADAVNDLLLWQSHLHHMTAQASAADSHHAPKLWRCLQAQMAALDAALPSGLMQT